MSHKPKTVLVVDDDEGDAGHADRDFSSWDFTVSCGRSGEAALPILKSRGRSI